MGISNCVGLGDGTGFAVGLYSGSGEGRVGACVARLVWGLVPVGEMVLTWICVMEGLTVGCSG